MRSSSQTSAGWGKQEKLLTGILKLGSNVTIIKKTGILSPVFILEEGFFTPANVTASVIKTKLC